MAMEDLEIARDVVVPGAEIRESASRSRGPGGQHVNKAATRVTLRWNVRRSAALDEARRERLLERLAPRLTRTGDLVVHADAARSRARNREAARARLAELVAEALRVSPTRRPTRPSRAARTRRVEEKRKRSDVKQRRGRIVDERD
jgi:ribosome-associated protein